MISLKDINKAIVLQVKSGLIKSTTYNNIEFASTDIKESIARPSFYLEFADNKTALFNANNKERTLSVKIYYFPKDAKKYKLELMEIQSYLEDIFLKYVKVSDEFFIYVDELDFDVSDGVLICTMELHTVEDISDELFVDTVHSTDGDNQELMENIELN